MKLPMNSANIQQGIAIYRKAGESLPHFVMGDWADASELTAGFSNVFCVQSFLQDTDMQVILPKLSGLGWEASQEQWFQCRHLFVSDVLPESTTHLNFVDEVLGIQKGISDHFLQKAVAARCKTHLCDLSSESVFSAFHALHEAYVGAFVFLLIHPIWGCWMGATPETLLIFDNNRATVMALAGTLTKEQTAWSDKEELEQEVTSQFISEMLLSEGIVSPNESKVRELAMGDIRHLVSEYTFELTQWNQARRLLNRLHPTPAVGGYPQKAACDWLMENESLQRNLYTGFLGLMGETAAQLYVTLRCCKLSQNGYTLYAGCGVNAKSIPQVEWMETEAKMNLVGAFLP